MTRLLLIWHMPRNSSDCFLSTVNAANNSNSCQNDLKSFASRCTGSLSIFFVNCSLLLQCTIAPYLPLILLPHSVCEEWFLSIGCAIGYWQGDVGKLVDDIAALKPAMFIGVPRVFDRIYSRIEGQVMNCFPLVFASVYVPCCCSCATFVSSCETLLRTAINYSVQCYL